MSDIKEVAKKLADAHRAADPATEMIKYFPDAAGDQVRLLEVSTAAPTTGEVLPFQFGSDPSHGIDFKSVVILLSPSEWQAVQENKLSLPTGWELAKAEEL